MTDTTYAPSAQLSAGAHADAETYARMYAESIADPDAFWGEHGKRIDWIKPFTTVRNVSYAHENVSINWYEDGTLNVSANCIDRHLAIRGDQTAIIWEADDPETPAKHITYKELHVAVCKMANIIAELGVRRGDRVVLYMPMVPEAAYAMLACARIGAIHSIVFAGFSPDALGARINGADAKLVITADEALRGGRATALKTNTDQALLHCKDTVKCLVVKRTGGQTTWVDGRDFDYNEMALEASDHCAPAEMN
ncbi:MAG: AMP-binding protein, partial [Pseudomonadota bacterium]